MKIAMVRLSWTKSPSMDIDRVELRVVINGNETLTTFGNEIEEFVTEINANSNVSFSLKVFDSEGKEASSETYTFGLGDLENPLPPTNLFHEVLSVRDDGDVPSSTGTETSTTAGESFGGAGRGAIPPRGRVPGR